VTTYASSEPDPGRLGGAGGLGGPAPPADLAVGGAGGLGGPAPPADLALGGAGGPGGPAPPADLALAAAAPIFAALGDPTRRGIFERVARHPQSVGELAGVLPVSRPAVSQHLRVLKQAGLVRDRPVGNRRIYEMDSRGIRDLRAYLDHFWNQALAAFKATVDQQQQEETS
jgi:DNA-binding transcriptional ArsR family regulator